MTGRYYHRNILAAFQADANPREMSFTRSDPTAAMLPEVLRRAGYVGVAVSAHTWVSPESDFGRAFDRFELLPFTSAEAHGDAEPLVDRAVALWSKRDRSRPTLLYVHFMDPHIPRRLPEGEPDHPVPGFDWRSRFRPDGEPSFGRTRRAWSRFDARDFTPVDRGHYAAVYDTTLRRMDAALGRLFDALEADDPGLARTLVVVTADHGEELGEDQRIEHGDSLADGVQHVPLVVTGAGLAPGTCAGVTEHVDVVPTLLAALGLALPGSQVVDGTARIAAGRLHPTCGGTVAFYAWEDYRAVRRGHHLLVERDAETIAGRCDGAARLFRLDGHRRTPHDADATSPRGRRLHALLEARLGERERAYRARRYDPPATPFMIRADAWRGLDPAAVPCLRIDEDTPHGAIAAARWLWSGRGVACLAPDATALSVAISVPPGTYRVEAATNPIARPPWLVGTARWRKRSFLSEEPSEFVPVGTFEAPAGRLELPLSAEIAGRRHVLALRLSPPGSATPAAVPGAVDPAQRERLRALGYVQ
jgi:hypothetical protein